MRSLHITETLDRVLMTLTVFEDLRASALFGSHADGSADSFSDVDVLVVASKTVPAGDERLRQYHAADLGATLSFDTESGAFRRDIVSMAELILDLHWIATPTAERVLHDLARDLDSDETLPAIIQSMRPLYDPHDTLTKLKRELPEYSLQRAAHRLQRVLRVADREFEVLRRLEAAAMRGDFWSFSEARQEMLGQLLQGLFALNRTWFRPQPRLLQRIGSFPLLPKNTPSLINSALSSDDLASAYDAIQALFGGLRQ